MTSYGLPSDWVPVTHAIGLKLPTWCRIQYVSRHLFICDITHSKTIIKVQCRRSWFVSWFVTPYILLHNQTSRHSAQPHADNPRVIFWRNIFFFWRNFFFGESLGKLMYSSSLCLCKLITGFVLHSPTTHTHKHTHTHTHTRIHSYFYGAF